MRNPTLALVLLSTLTLSGCAKTHVGNLHESLASDMPRPSRILIQNFSANMQNVKTSSSPFAKIKDMVSDESPDQAKQELTQEVVKALSEELSEKVKEMGYTAVMATNDAQPEKGDLLITGRILDMDEGNALRRNLIGLGAGQSSLNSEVKILGGSNSGTKTLIDFKVHADSGNMPGAAVMGPAGAAAGASAAAATAANVAKGAASTYSSSSAHQAKSLADNIVKELTSYYQKQGWAIEKQ